MASSTRRLGGLILVIAAAVTAVASGFAGWYGENRGNDIRLPDLFDQLTPRTADSLGSLLIPMLLGVVLVAVGIALWWRWLWALAGAVVIATVVLWIVRQAQTAQGLHARFVGAGPWMAGSAGAAMAAAAALTTARGRSPRTRADRLSPGWTLAAGTEVGRLENPSEAAQREGLGEPDPLEGLEAPDGASDVRLLDTRDEAARVERVGDVRLLDDILG